MRPFHARPPLPAVGLALTVVIGAIALVVAGRLPAGRGSEPPAQHIATSGQDAPRAVTVSRRSVAPLRHLSQPDLLVTTGRPLTAKQLAALRKDTHARQLAAFDVGSVWIAGRRLRTVGVDPSSFRGFMPPPTAASDRLWENVVAGDLAASYSTSRRVRLPIGGMVSVRAQRLEYRLRIGAAAAFDLPYVDLVVARSVGAAVGLHPRTGVVLTAPGRSASELAAAAREAVGRNARIVPLNAASAASGSDKPRTYVELYHAAARPCAGLSWSLLAAIGQIESGHGVNVGPSRKGALGPMQFLPSTWQEWGVDADGDHKADIMNPYDAVYTAARFLCWYGAGRGGDDLRRAIFAYNHAEWYVRDVIALARLYRY